MVRPTVNLCIHCNESRLRGETHHTRASTRSCFLVRRIVHENFDRYGIYSTVPDTGHVESNGPPKRGRKIASAKSDAFSFYSHNFEHRRGLLQPIPEEIVVECLTPDTSGKVCISTNASGQVSVTQPFSHRGKSAATQWAIQDGSLVAEDILSSTWITATQYKRDPTTRKTVPGFYSPSYYRCSGISANSKREEDWASDDSQEQCHPITPPSVRQQFFLSRRTKRLPTYYGDQTNLLGFLQDVYDLTFTGEDYDPEMYDLAVHGGKLYKVPTIYMPDLKANVLWVHKLKCPNKPFTCLCYSGWIIQAPDCPVADLLCLDEVDKCDPTPMLDRIAILEQYQVADDGCLVDLSTNHARAPALLHAAKSEYALWLKL